MHHTRAQQIRPVSPFALLALLGIATFGVAMSGAADAPVRSGWSVKNSPGWYPPADPESTAERIGRRVNAPLVSKPFTGGARSLDELGRTICRHLHRSDRDSLFGLCVTTEEFRDILWREFPQSRPATGLQWQDAWTALGARLMDGTGHAIRDHGGHVYVFKGFEVDSVAVYKNFRLHLNITLVAQDDEGQVRRMRWLRGIAERKGRFKIYSTTD